MAKKSSKASYLSLLIAGIALITSVVLTLVTRQTAHAFLLHLIGYLLTPLVVALCMGWDSINQRKKTKDDPWFEKNPKLSFVLRLLTGVSFIVAFPHISAMAKDIAEKWATSRGI